MRFSVEKKTKLITVIMALTSITIIVGVIGPAIFYIKKLYDDTHNLKTYLEKRYENSLRLRASIQKIDEVKKETKKLSELLFTTSDELKLITLLENNATINNVNQRIINSTLGRPQNNIISVSINANGKYTDLIKYINGLESTDYFLNIRQLQIFPQISRTANNSSSTLSELNLELELYVNNL